MNYFLQAMSKYAQFTGRSRRSEYWYFTLFYVLISNTLVLGATFLIGQEIGAIINIGIAIAFLLPSIGVGVRRMHDVNKSGWFILIPIYNLILACTNGDMGPNEYGEDPKGKTAGYDSPLDQM